LIGHEFIGVEQVGSDVGRLTEGDLVVAPFIYSHTSCPHCLNGSTISCVQGGNSATARSTVARDELCVSRWPAAPWSR
jgi:threonine dehydrogenase-like Zn-dependent dehydrogenase